jgi:hypothetical protein
VSELSASKQRWQTAAMSTVSTRNNIWPRVKIQPRCKLHVLSASNVPPSAFKGEAKAWREPYLLPRFTAALGSKIHSDLHEMKVMYRAKTVHWIGGRMSPTARSNNAEKGKFLTLPGLRLRPQGQTTSSQSSISLSRLLLYILMHFCFNIRFTH